MKTESKPETEKNKEKIKIPTGMLQQPKKTKKSHMKKERKNL